MDRLPSGIVPYCGAPPLPLELISRWNLDPWLLEALAVALGLYVAGVRNLRPEQRSGTREASYFAGWAIASLALVSPLCALSVSLFAARVGQHMLLTLAAAPLIAFGRPVEVFAAALGQSSAGAHRRGRDLSLPAAVLFAGLLWFWHAPAPYGATFLSPAAYWAMHLSLVGAAIWLWSCMLDGEPTASGLGAAALSMIQMGLLGALITLAPATLYWPHRLTTAAWGMDPLQDQQLGGAIMWALGALAFLVPATIMAIRLVGPRLADPRQATP